MTTTTERPTVQKRRTRRASYPERRRVQQFNTLHPVTRARGTLTGVVVNDLTDDVIWVRLYSAGCLHDEHPVLRAEAESIVDDPRSDG